MNDNGSETTANMTDIIPFEDPRGVLKKIVMQSQLKNDRLEEVYLIYTLQGGVRGNHYHKVTLEYFTVVSGRAVIALKDLSTGISGRWHVSADDNKVIKVPPGVVHAFKNEAKEPLVILAVSTKEYNSSDTDTFTLTLLE